MSKHPEWILLIASGLILLGFVWGVEWEIDSTIELSDIAALVGALCSAGLLLVAGMGLGEYKRSEQYKRSYSAAEEMKHASIGMNLSMYMKHLDLLVLMITALFDQVEVGTKKNRIELCRLYRNNMKNNFEALAVLRTKQSYFKSIKPELFLCCEKIITEIDRVDKLVHVNLSVMDLSTELGGDDLEMRVDLIERRLKLSVNTNLDLYSRSLEGIGIEDLLNPFPDAVDCNVMLDGFLVDFIAGEE
jgi:hypothetical protein